MALRPILTKGLPFSSTPWSAPGERYTGHLQNWGILNSSCSTQVMCWEEASKRDHMPLASRSTPTIGLLGKVC